MHKKILSTFVILGSLTIIMADVPNTFQASTPAKASEVNENFSSLDTRITDLETAASSSSSNSTNSTPQGYTDVNVNGVSMKVASFALGYYTIITPTDITVNVDVNGLPSTLLYFATEDCSGIPYFRTNLPDENIAVGHTYTNPRINSQISFAYDSQNTLYTDHSSVIKLNYNSMYSSSGCSSTSGSVIASEGYHNDMNVTGISFPAIITDIGSPLTVTDEVGSNVRNRIVYSNGMRIGVTRYFSISPDMPISVQLDDYPDQYVTMYKDGTYTGLTMGRNENLYYLDDNCSGNAYVKVLNDYDKEWWTKSELTTEYIVNYNDYYSLSSTIYKMSAGSHSYKNSYSGSCYKTSTIIKNGYKKATTIDAPSAPIYAAPITVEDFTDDTTYNDLTEAD